MTVTEKIDSGFYKILGCQFHSYREQFNLKKERFRADIEKELNVSSYDKKRVARFKKAFKSIRDGHKAVLGVYQGLYDTDRGTPSKHFNI